MLLHWLRNTSNAKTCLRCAVRYNIHLGTAPENKLVVHSQLRQLDSLTSVVARMDPTNDDISDTFIHCRACEYQRENSNADCRKCGVTYSIYDGGRPDLPWFGLFLDEFNQRSSQGQKDHMDMCQIRVDGGGRYHYSPSVMPDVPEARDYDAASRHRASVQSSVHAHVSGQRSRSASPRRVASFNPLTSGREPQGYLTEQTQGLRNAAIHVSNSSQASNARGSTARHILRPDDTHRIGVSPTAIQSDLSATTGLALPDPTSQLHSRQAGHSPGMFPFSYDRHEFMDLHPPLKVQVTDFSRSLEQLQLPVQIQIQSDGQARQLIKSWCEGMSGTVAEAKIRRWSLWHDRQVKEVIREIEMYAEPFRTNDTWKADMVELQQKIEAQVIITCHDFRKIAKRYTVYPSLNSMDVFRMLSVRAWSTFDVFREGLQDIQSSFEKDGAQKLVQMEASANHVGQVVQWHRFRVGSYLPSPAATCLSIHRLVWPNDFECWNRDEQQRPKASSNVGVEQTT